ncbi:MAG: lanthionine synthetase LanC family protein [Planctomycetota bacterium]|jgi:lantibiotic modifying enzyme
MIAVLPVLGCTGADPTYRRAALDTGRWLRACAVGDGDSCAWPADADRPDSITTNLYSGVAGVVLFLLEAHAATGEEHHLQLARAGANYLLAQVPQELRARGDAGLYTGVAGVGFVLHEVFRATNEEAYLDGARACVQTLRANARRAGDGVYWNDANEIVYGTAGIGLFLLYAAREMADPRALGLAEACGRRLLKVALPAEEGGLKWERWPDYPQLQPNFSHGGAGVCYFLATLYQETKKREFLDAALQGASYLQAVGGESCLVFHDEPAGKKLFYLSWCHGPPGTTRLYYRLHQITGNRKWMNLMERAARSVMESGIPEQRTPGFWNNVSVCCGNAGVVDFFLDLHRITGDERYLAFGKRVARDLLARATRDDRGMRWAQAEYRIRPKFLQVQTGYSQGAAGIGILLLRLDAREHNRETRITLPDSPFDRPQGG